MKFHYTAVNKEGKRIEGTAEAANKANLITSLKNQDVRPMVITAEHTKGSLFGRKKKVKLKDLVVFTRQLSTMISAGVSLTGALNTLQEQTGNKFFKESLSQVVKDVEGGISLADALEKHPKVFSPVYVNMVRAGEAGGILEDILKKLAVQQEKDAAIRNKVKSASVYPLVLITITVGAFFALTIFVIPKIGAMLKDIGGEDAALPPLTTMMLGISEIMQTQWYFLLAILIGGIVFFRRWRKTPAGKAKIDAFLLRLPVLKTIVTKVAIARFSRIFSSLTAAGVTVLEALDITGKSLNNTVIEKELQEAAKAVKNGKPLSQPLAASPHFPPIVSQMLAVGEETGETETVLLKVADFYEQEVDAVVDGLSSIIEPIMILIMGGMVGLVAASVIGPISSLSQNIEGSILTPNILTLFRLWL